MRKSDLSDVDESLINWLKQDRSDNVPVGGTLLLITFNFPKF
jgi:hypothetical protein